MFSDPPLKNKNKYKVMYLTNPVTYFCDQLTELAYYGNMGCAVFKRGIQNWKDFCLSINIPKGND